VLGIAKDLIFGVRDLHTNHIIHRDLKPENIVYDSEAGRYVIIDLGSASLHKQNLRPFSYMQSRYYRAPEIALKQDYGLKVDIWSIGCILVELLTQKPLFHAKTNFELVEMHLNCDLGDLFYEGWKSWFLELSPEQKKLKAIIHNCLRLQPSKRASISDLLLYF
jgi:serine/threonine protein kinase